MRNEPLNHEILMISENLFISEYKDQEVHWRGCIDLELPIGDDCVEIDAEKQDGKAHVCFCSSDLCNSAQRLGSSGVFGVIFLLVLIISRPCNAASSSSFHIKIVIELKQKLHN